MADPTTLAELTAIQIANTSADAIGTTTLACLFCGAAGFMVLPLVSNRDAMAAGATCATCGRSGKFSYSGDVVIPGVPFTFVQTGGVDPLPFMDPMPARE